MNIDIFYEDFRLIEPSPILRPFIENYVVVETSGLSEYGTQQRVYPRGCIDLVFHYGRPFFFQKRNKPPVLEPRSVVCGQQTSFYDVCPAGKTGMILVMFRSCGAGVFFKMPMIEIAGQNVAFEHLIGKEAVEIEDQVLHASHNQERIQIIETFLIQQLIQNHYDDKKVRAAFYKMNQGDGQISIKQLAETVCLSVKQFERKFSGLIGLNPKQFLRIVRFQNVLRMKKTGFKGSLTALAQESGYYDQSHFVNDFKNITGSAPKKFFSDIQPGPENISDE